MKNLYAFGSATTENFNENSSDIDLLIEKEENDPLERGEKLLAIWDKLEEFPKEGGFIDRIIAKKSNFKKKY